MQEIITLIILAMLIAAAGFWTGLCWSERAWMDMQCEIELQKALNRAMEKGIELRDAQIEQKDRVIKNDTTIKHELRKQVALLTGINSLPQ